MTSHYAAVKHLPPDAEPVAISRGIPVWFSGRREQSLAPSWAMLKMPPAEYDEHFAHLLATLDPRTVYEQLGEQAVLLCWERPNVRCHRRLVAEWLERALGVVIPEFGLERRESLPFAAQPPKRAGRSGRSLFD
jgi:hypothetical protein